MSRMGTKLLLACLLLCFGVFYGVNMTTKGVEQIYGPIQQESSSVSSEAEEPLNDTVKENENILQSELRPEIPDKMIHRVADKTGELVHITVQNGVEVIVSLFEKVIH